MKKMRKRKRLLPSKAKGRAAVTNGTLLLIDCDGRSRAARRYKDCFRKYMAETDGRQEETCKQLASLVTQRELLDASLVRGEHVDSLHLVRLCGAINRTLGLLRRATVDPEDVRDRRRREDREAGLIV